MKKLAFLTGVLAVLVCGTGAWAAISITFDDLTAGPDQTRYDGTHISNQYASLGITWLGDTHAPANPSYTGQVVVNSIDWTWLQSNAIWYYGQGGTGVTPVESPILLDFTANSLSFDYRRPNQGGTLSVDLLYDGARVDYFALALTASWQSFSYTASDSNGLFNEVIISANDKFLTDNYQFGVAPVPIPPSILLLAGGLGSLGFLRRKRARN